MLGEHDKAGGVAVEAVDTAVDEGFTFLFKIPCNAVCQRIFIISNRRMNRRISGFIHNEDVVILIHNRKRNRPRRIPSEGSVSTRCVSITSPACTAWLVQARTPFRKMPSSVRFKPVIIWREYPCRRRNHSTVRFSRSSSGETTYVNLCPIHKTSVSIAFLRMNPVISGAKFQKETFPVFRKYSRKQMEKQETYLFIAKI